MRIECILRDILQPDIYTLVRRSISRPGAYFIAARLQLPQLTPLHTFTYQVYLYIYAFDFGFGYLTDWRSFLSSFVRQRTFTFHGVALYCYIHGQVLLRAYILNAHVVFFWDVWWQSPISRSLDALDRWLWVLYYLSCILIKTHWLWPLGVHFISITYIFGNKISPLIKSVVRTKE